MRWRIMSNPHPIYQEQKWGRENLLPTGTVTFLFTDIQGSTPLWEQMPAEMQAAAAQHHTILCQAIETNGGQVFQIVDEMQAFFLDSSPE